MSGQDPGNVSIHDDKSSTKNAAPVDTTKQFIETINETLHGSGAGIQIIMEESKDAQWFKQKQRDMEKHSGKQYGNMRKWQVAPKTFAAIEKANSIETKGSQASSNALHQPAEMSRTSIPKFANSPSGGLSERRWRSPGPENIVLEGAD